MPSKKMSFTFPPELPEVIRHAAEEEHMPISMWMARAAEAQARRQRRRALVAEYEAENGAFTPDELAEARAVLATAEARLIAAERDDR